MVVPIGFMCFMVGLASLVAITIDVEDKKLRVAACGFYAPAMLLFAFAVEYRARGDGHPGFWVGAVGCLLVALGVHARAMGHDL